MSRWSLSLRARNTPPSPIRKLAGKANAAKGRGVRVHHLNIGQPDIETPAAFLEGIRSFDKPVVAYEASPGADGLRRAWSGLLTSQLGVRFAPDHMLITTGASEALVFLFMTLCDPGDEVIIFDPSYANYMSFAAIAGVNLTPLLTTMETEFALPETALIEDHLSNRTRAILLCNPNNPTGTICDAERLRSLLALCHKHRLFLVVDETYRELVFDGRHCPSIFEAAGPDPQVVVVDSLSKRFSLCGARLGCLVSFNPHILESCIALAQARLAAPSIEQHAAEYLLNNLASDYVDAVRREYQLRRDKLHDALGGIPGVEAFKPHAAFYTIARLPVNCAEQFAAFLLDEFSLDGETVFLAPAAGFYMSRERGENKVRLAGVLESRELERAAQVIAEGLEAFSASA